MAGRPRRRTAMRTRGGSAVQLEGGCPRLCKGDCWLPVPRCCSSDADRHVVSSTERPERGRCLPTRTQRCRRGRLAGSGTEMGHHDCGFKELLRGCRRRCAVAAAKAQGAIILRASTMRRPKQPATPATMHIISRLRSSRRLSSCGTWQRGGTGARSARPQDRATNRACRPSEVRCFAHTHAPPPPTCHPPTPSPAPHHSILQRAGGLEQAVAEHHVQGGHGREVEQRVAGQQGEQVDGLPVGPLAE